MDHPPPDRGEDRGDRPRDRRHAPDSPAAPARLSGTPPPPLREDKRLETFVVKVALQAALIGAPFACGAAETNRVAELPAIVVEATRLGQTPKEIPSHVEVLGREDVASSGAQTTVDLLEKRANLFLRKQNGNPSLAQVALRGYGANSFGRVKILVDGEELTNPDMAAQNLLRVPVRSIERVEILHGPQTVLHGGNASAGVINILTDAADRFTRKTTLEIHGGNLGAVGAHVGTHGGFEDLGLSYFGDFDYDRADGWRQNGWYHTYSVKGGLRQDFENGSFVSLKVFYANQEYGLPGGVWQKGYDWYGQPHGAWEDEPYRDAETPNDRSRSDTYGTMLNSEIILTDENLLKAGFTFSNRKVHTDYRSYSSENDADVYTFDWNLMLENTADLFGFRNQFDLGTDHKLDLLYVEAANKNDYTRYAPALFAHEEFWLFDSLSLFGGARGEWFWSGNTFESGGVRTHDSETTGAVAGEAGVNWRPVDDLKVFAKWSHFYHAPLADEMFSYYGVPNLDLKPEEGDDAQIGVDWTFLDDFNFTATYFHTEIRDEILYQYYANRNADDRTARDGFEATLAWSRERVGSAGVLFNQTWARFADGPNEDCEIPLVPEQTLRVWGEVFLVDWFAVSAGYRFVGRQRYEGDFANANEHLPAFGLFDIGARFVPTWRWLEGWTAAFTLDNLFDTRYADYGVYNGVGYGTMVYPGCGRSVSFSIRYEF